MANNTDSALEDAGGEDGCCRDNKTCLWITVVGGVCLLITEIIIAGVTLIAPKDVGISADDELCAGQRAFLGGFTVIIFLEGALIASWDWCKCFISNSPALIIASLLLTSCKYSIFCLLIDSSY